MDLLMNLVRRYALVTVLLLVLVSVTLNVVTLAYQTATSSRNCHQIENIKTEIRSVIASQIATLGTPGSAGYTYYATHPAELAQARKAAAAELVVFAASRCP